MNQMNRQDIVNEVVSDYKRIYGREPDVVSRAPGRLEILGNHTDYNEGTVLSVAVDRGIYFAAGRVPSGSLCRIEDAALNSRRSFSLEHLDDRRPGDWANYIKGVIVEFQKRGIQIPAFDAVLFGTVPLSAGMSSSAALEIAAVLALRDLAGAQMSWQECARIGQGAENNYIGAHTGLLDQFSSLKGRKGQLVYSDFRTLEVANVPIPQGTAFVVASSMVKHNLTNEYNERREACEDAARVLAKIYPGVKSLRDVSMSQLQEAQKYMTVTSYRRALHVVGEIERVAEGCKVLQSGDVAAFGKLMSASHLSSRYHFENSCPELDMLVDLGSGLPGFLGARLSGGGFGGITVHLVKAGQAGEYMEKLAAGYEKCSGLKTEAMICQADDGADLQVWR